MGRERVGGHGLQPQREGPRPRRGAEEQAAGARPPLRLRGRRLPEARLGRGLRERGREGGYNCGYREVIGAAEGFTESSECWREFLSWLRSRGLRGVRVFTGDKAAGTAGPVAEAFPEAAHRRRAVRFHRNALARVPKPGRAKAAAMPKAAHAMESREASEAKALEAAAEPEGMRLGEAAKVAREGYAETLAYTRFPPEHWRRIRTNNAIERLNREIRRRTRVVGTFPDGKSALMLVTARLKYIAESEWGSRRYLDVTLLDE